MVTMNRVYALDLINICYQQNGGTLHIAGITMELLRELFPLPVISRNVNVYWHQLSLDLTVTDFFLCEETRNA